MSLKQHRGVVTSSSTRHTCTRTFTRRPLHALLPAGYSADLSGLLYIRRSIPNFDIYQRRSSISGWADRPGANICTWSGVTCNSNGSVTGLNFLSTTSVLIGAHACSAPGEDTSKSHVDCYFHVCLLLSCTSQSLTHFGKDSLAYLFVSRDYK